MSAEENLQQIELKATSRRLNAVSPSFCLAKWLQVTLHLHVGLNHSCHHPGLYKIDANDLLNNPGGLHNTPFKMEQRKLMLSGERPKECDYCWRIEDAAKNNFSDRHSKSNDSWAKPHLETISKLPWNTPVIPTYLEVSFGNACNFKCSYCQPVASSLWSKEILKEGGYVLTQTELHRREEVREMKTRMFKTEEENPYVQSFWEWWPELAKNLKIFRITGGEPLMSPSTMKVIDFFSENRHPNLEFSINTNLGLPGKKVESFALRVQQLIVNENVKNFSLFTSLDTWGEQAEYIRDGLDLKTFTKNFDIILRTVSPIKICFMVTFNILSLGRFEEFLQFVIDRRRFVREELKNGNEIFIDVSYLRHPSLLAANIATDQLLERAQAILDFMRAHTIESQPDGFYFFEIQKMDRTLKWMRANHDREIVNRDRADFFAFISEYDRRRSKNFASVFPSHLELFEIGRAQHARLSVRRNEPGNAGQ